MTTDKNNIFDNDLGDLELTIPGVLPLNPTESQLQQFNDYKTRSIIEEGLKSKLNKSPKILPLDSKPNLDILDKMRLQFEKSIFDAYNLPLKNHSVKYGSLEYLERIIGNYTYTEKFIVDNCYGDLYLTLKTDMHYIGGMYRIEILDSSGSILLNFVTEAIIGNGLTPLQPNTISFALKGEPDVLSKLTENMYDVRFQFLSLNKN